MSVDKAVRTPSDTLGDPFEPFDPTRWQGKPVPERPWLWDDWIPFGETTALYGDGGTGKSLLALQLLVAAATGRPFVGHNVQRVKALGIFCEDDLAELHRRLESILGTMGLSYTDLADLALVSRVGDENLMMVFRADAKGETTDLYQQIAGLTKMRGVQLLVIDTAADVFGGNENIRPHVRQFVACLTRIAKATNAAVVLLAHPSVSGKASGSGDGGSTAWNNSVRSRLYLDRITSKDGAEEDRNVRRLSRQKANYAQSGAKLKLRYESGCFVGGYEDSVSNVPVRNLDAEAAFLRGLAELSGKNIRMGTWHGQKNYAPTILRRQTNICSCFEEAALAIAMDQLISDHRIEIRTDGPPSRRRTFLATTEDTLSVLGSEARDGGEAIHLHRVSSYDER